MTSILTNRALVEQLVTVATEQQANQLLSQHDPNEVASAVLNEVAARAVLLSGPPVPVTVQFDLQWNGQRIGIRMLTGPGFATVAPGWEEQPWVCVRSGLAELLVDVYGTVANADPAWEIVVRDQPGPSGPAADDTWLSQWSAARAAAGMVLRASGPSGQDLSALALRFGSDKWGGHRYTPHYERHLAGYRDRAVRLLEIGIGGYQSSTHGGASLRMWKYYFPRGLVYGLDLVDKSALDEDRIRTIQGDQSDSDSLASVAHEVGPLDIVIDDGSHVSSHVITSFTTLFPRLRVGGLYIIEDLHTSYWPGWNGGRVDPHDPGTTMGFLKTLLDELHRSERPGVSPNGSQGRQPTVTGVHVYRNIAFLEKGVDNEQPAPAWLRGEG